MKKLAVNSMKKVVRKQTRHRFLTPDEEDFCQYICSLRMSAHEAYKEAGCKCKGGVASLMSQEHIQRRINELRKTYIAPLLIDIAERQRLLTDIATSCKSSNRDKIKALDLLNRLAGDYVERTEITGRDGGAISVSWEQ